MANNTQPERPSTINFDFIRELEGGLVLSAYVPDPENSKSGVTIAAGFDLGTRNDKDLRKLALNATFIGKLYPYLGRQGKEAHNYLGKFPLTISVHEAAAIDSGVKRKLLDSLKRRFNKDSDVPFKSIPPCWQTVIASVEFQYGNLSRRCPTFWQWVVYQKWEKAELELRDFGDKYSSRRIKEADYVIANS